MKTEYDDIKRFNIKNEIIVSSNNNDIKLNVISDNWILRAVSLKYSFLSLHFFNPDYTSYTYKTDNLFESKKLNNTNYNDDYNVSVVKFDNNELINDKNLGVEYFNLFSVADNGFSITSKSLKIYTTSFYNKITGLIFIP